jgi:hypothetical protein
VRRDCPPPRVQVLRVLQRQPWEPPLRRDRHVHQQLLLEPLAWQQLDRLGRNSQSYRVAVRPE